MQIEKFASGDDASASMGSKSEQVAFVASDQEVGRAGYGNREKVVVVRIGRGVDDSQGTYVDGQGAKIVD